MKRLYFFIGVPVILLIAACLYIFFSLQMVHRSIVEEAHNYQPKSMISFDERYVLKTYSIQEHTGVYASFSVVLQDTQVEVYHCPDRYRTMDLKSISWGDSTLDIIVESGDVGSVSYQFANDSWERK